MVQIVTAANRSLHERSLDLMHRDRKRVFVDRLKWSVPVVDQFDGPGAVYLLQCEAGTGRHLASLRLLPTTRPHLLKDVFPRLCEGEIPVGEEIMELTRFCVTPDAPKEGALQLMNLMWVAAVEYAVLFGIERYTCVSHLQMLSMMLSSGWDAEPLGLPQSIDENTIGAIIFTITQATLRECRRRFSYPTPVLESRQVEAA
jgi:N-acyl-L-homoserine lactone synthetase